MGVAVSAAELRHSKHEFILKSCRNTKAGQLFPEIPFSGNSNGFAAGQNHVGVVTTVSDCMNGIPFTGTSRSTIPEGSILVSRTP